MIMPTMVLMMVTKKIKLVMMRTMRTMKMMRTKRIFLQRFPVFAAAPSAAPKPPRVKRILPLS